MSFLCVITIFHACAVQKKDEHCCGEKSAVQKKDVNLAVVFAVDLALVLAVDFAGSLLWTWL